MKLFTHKIKRPLHIAYIIGLFGMILLLICISTTRSYDSKALESPNFWDISSDWRISPDSTQSLNLRQLGSYCDSDSKTLNLYYKIPELSKDSALIYRSKDVYTSLYLGDQKIYETHVPTSRFYNKSPGNIWNKVILDKSYSGQILRLQLDIVYDTNAVTADSFFLGDGTNIVINYVYRNMFALTISLIMILLGMAIIIMDVISQTRSSYTGHSLLYLGLYSFLIGIWSLLETNVPQFFTRDPRILQLLDNMIMIVDTLPLFLYLDYIYNSFNQKITRYLCILDCAYIYVCCIAQFTGISDIHHLLPGSHIALVIGSVMFLVWIIHAYLISRNDKEALTPVMLQMLGIAALFVTAIIGLLKFANGDFSDRAGSMRVGMLLFIIFFGASSQIQSNRLIAKGMKYNVVKTLAYKDGLTSLGNRTAYLEKLESYTHSNLKQLGIVYLDINNLKTVNDHQGHEAGDTLIQEGASIIQKSFGSYGNSYRIGGDEFCVFLDGENLLETYKNAQSTFYKLLKETNNTCQFPFEIHIAHGFSICTEMTKDSLKEAIDLADQVMYEDKTKIKQHNKQG